MKWRRLGKRGKLRKQQFSESTYFGLKRAGEKRTVLCLSKLTVTRCGVRGALQNVESREVTVLWGVVRHIWEPYSEDGRKLFRRGLQAMMKQCIEVSEKEHTGLFGALNYTRFLLAQS